MAGPCFLSGIKTMKTLVTWTINDAWWLGHIMSNSRELAAWGQSSKTLEQTVETLSRHINRISIENQELKLRQESESRDIANLFERIGHLGLIRPVHAPDGVSKHEFYEKVKELEQEQRVVHEFARGVSIKIAEAEKKALKAMKQSELVHSSAVAQVHAELDSIAERVWNVEVGYLHARSDITELQEVMHIKSSGKSPRRDLVVPARTRPSDRDDSPESRVVLYRDPPKRDASSEDRIVPYKKTGEVLYNLPPDEPE